MQMVKPQKNNEPLLNSKPTKTNTYCVRFKHWVGLHKGTNPNYIAKSSYEIEVAWALRFLIKGPIVGQGTIADRGAASLESEPGRGVDPDSSERRKAKTLTGALDLRDGGRDRAEVELDLDLGLTSVLAQHQHDLVDSGVGDEAGSVKEDHPGSSLQRTGTETETSPARINEDRVSRTRYELSFIVVVDRVTEGVDNRVGLDGGRHDSAPPGVVEILRDVQNVLKLFFFFVHVWYTKKNIIINIFFG